MNRVLKLIAIGLGLFLAVAALIAFVNWSIDPRTWGFGGRLFAGWVWLVGFGFAVAAEGRTDGPKR